MQEIDYERLYVRAKEEKLMTLFASICPEPKRSELFDLSDWMAVLERGYFREPLLGAVLEGWKPKITDYATGLRVLETYVDRSKVALSVCTRLLEIVEDPWELIRLEPWCPFGSGLREEIIVKVLQHPPSEGDFWQAFSGICRYERGLWAEIAEALEGICETTGHAIALYRLGSDIQKLKAMQCLESLGADFEAWWLAYDWETKEFMASGAFNRLYDLAGKFSECKKLAERSSGRERSKILNKAIQHLETVEDGCWLYVQSKVGSALSASAETFLRLLPPGLSKWRSVLGVAHHESAFRKEAITHLQGLSTSFADWRWLYEHTTAWEVSRGELFTRMVRLGETYDEVRWVYERCEGKVLTDLALRKMARFAVTREQILSVWERLPSNTALAKELALRLLTAENL